jgi:hypothetical protein
MSRYCRRATSEIFPVFTVLVASAFCLYSHTVTPQRPVPPANCRRFFTDHADTNCWYTWNLSPSSPAYEGQPPHLPSSVDGTTLLLTQTRDMQEAIPHGP